MLSSDLSLALTAMCFAPVRTDAAGSKVVTRHPIKRNQRVLFADLEDQLVVEIRHGHPQENEPGSFAFEDEATSR